uniref:ZZ-type domain-containing protein n=1 Tax=Globodera pallida TaxID=36090 RepID=A0A183CHC7_GLOPA
MYPSSSAQNGPPEEAKMVSLNVPTAGTGQEQQQQVVAIVNGAQLPLMNQQKVVPQKFTQPPVHRYLIPRISVELQALIDEMRLRDFDSIRFATYRTACKLRFVQTKTNVHLVDIWNMIESFRENGLNAMATGANLKISRLELLLTSVFHNLNKRLPTNQQIDTDKAIATLLHFLLSAYDRQHIGRLTVFAVKVGLATLCAGKLVDKLRYMFSQISDPTGAVLDHEKFAEYLQQVLALPTAIFEGPTFGYTELALTQCFQRNAPEPVTLNQFLDAIMGEQCPPCLMWLPLLHRMASVESVFHPVMCDSCQCQRCTNYQLCQSCFWRGRVSQSHSNEHEMKEYSSYKSPTKQLAHSIQKSLQCVPVTHQKTHKEFPTRPQRPLDLANVVPSTPLVTVRRQPPEPVAEWTSQLLPGQYGNASAMEDEHKLIARYAAKLAGRTVYASSSSTSAPAVQRGASNLARMQNQQLDERAMEENQEMLREMAALEEQRLNGLRERTAELEMRMREKQLLRRQLMEQLEQLMAQLN